MGPIWGRHDPGGPHVDPMNLAIWVLLTIKFSFICEGQNTMQDPHNNNILVLKRCPGHVTIFNRMRWVIYRFNLVTNVALNMEIIIDTCNGIIREFSAIKLISPL